MTKELEPFCFWCGGNARFDFQTPAREFYEDVNTMCDSCASLKGDGILVFELTDRNPGCGNPARVSDSIYYTGRWVIIDDMAAAAIFPPQMLPGVLHTRIAGLRYDNYARAGFDKYPWRAIQ